MQYRKKPIVVDAVRITAADFNGKTFDSSPFSEMPDWLEKALQNGTIKISNTNCTDYAEWAIDTLEGTMIAGPDDYIIQGVKGELYFCKPDIFATTYAPVEFGE